MKHATPKYQRLDEILERSLDAPDGTFGKVVGGVCRRIGLDHELSEDTKSIIRAHKRRHPKTPVPVFTRP